MPKVLLLAWDRVSKIKDAFGNKQYKPEDVQGLIRKLFNDVQNIHEELAEYINTPSWNRLAFYNYDDDDDEDYTIAITLEEPDNSLNQFEDFFDSNDDSTSIDDNNLSIDDIDYVEASPPDSELSPSPFPILVEDSDSLFKKSDTSLSYSDNSLPEFETFSDPTEETSSGSTTTHVDVLISNFNHGSMICKISMLHVPPESNEFEGEIIPCSDFCLGTSQPCG
nr:hypothetical protein [Tanacetum cinerariifolium]